jgi:prephenate dehydrogenase
MLWSALGCRVYKMAPDEHDRDLALTSHLPHAVASALAGVVPRDKLHLAAGAYRDGTRVAAADSELWAGIFMENRQWLNSALSELEQRLRELQLQLRDGDANGLRQWWAAGREAREQFNDTPEL